MRPVTFAIPGDIDTPTGGYRYDRALMSALVARGHDVEHMVLGAGFPAPSHAEEAAARQMLSTVHSAKALIVDGLAYGVLPELETLAPIVALVHHPLALETGVAADDVARLRISERAALQHATAIVVTSPHTQEILAAEFSVPAEKVSVALPGLDPLWASISNAPADPPLIVSVGSLTARKGHDVLVEALTKVADLDWRCEIIGSGSRDGHIARELAARVEASGLSERIALKGALEEAEIAERYGRATLFALATRYEGFGMVFAEAMAAGLPVVGTRAGAVPGVVPPGAGCLVPPEDPEAFAGALRAILADKAERGRMAAAAKSAGANFAGWDETARIVSDVVEALP